MKLHQACTCYCGYVFLLPRYLKQGITTVPDFLEDRFDSGVKKIFQCYFYCCYVLNLLPTTLYSGAIALKSDI